MENQASLLANGLIFAVIIGFMLGAVRRKVNLYEAFVDGAKEGFQVAVGIIPYLVAMLVAIGVFRASGALDLILDGGRALVGTLGLDGRFIDGLPTALLRPLSGGGARGMMIETMQTHGVDSFAGRLVSVIQGSTETTFYVLAVYFGSVGIRRCWWCTSTWGTRWWPAPWGASCIAGCGPRKRAPMNPPSRSSFRPTTRPAASRPPYATN